MRWLKVLTLGGALALAAATPAPAAQPAIPIPGPLDGPLPLFEGAAVAAQPLNVALPPRNPALAPNGRNGSGLAAANGGASPFPGPLGAGTSSESAFQGGGCSSLAFDAETRLLALCTGPLGPSLRLLDPTSLDTIDTFSLPRAAGPPDRADLSGGSHFIVRADGSLLIPANDATLIEVKVGAGSLEQEATIDLAGLLAAGERPFAVAAGFDGSDWVAGNAGTIVTLPRQGAEPQTLALGEPVAEDIATDRSGTYVLTEAALYRLRAGSDGAPRIVWRQPIPSVPADPDSGRIHPGPGTPPALIAGRYVAVADGLDPPNLRVLRIRGRGLQRSFCSVGVFDRGPAAVEAQLVVAGRSIVVSNSFGYESVLSTEGGATTDGGLAEVFVGRHGCRLGWSSRAISPSAQPVVSRATGLLYTLSKPPGFPDAWNLTAIDWRSGETRFSALAGEGLGHNSEGGALVLGPDGAAYAASFGGVLRFADG